MVWLHVVSVVQPARIFPKFKNCLGVNILCKRCPHTPVRLITVMSVPPETMLAFHPSLVLLSNLTPCYSGLLPPRLAESACAHVCV